MLFQKSLTSFLQNSKGFGGRRGLIGSQLFVIHSIFLPSYSYFITILFDIHFSMESGAHLYSLFFSGNRKTLCSECYNAKCFLFVFIFKPLFIIHHSATTPETVLLETLFQETQPCLLKKVILNIFKFRSGAMA